MNFTVKEECNISDVADFLASAILNQLKEGKKVLFFVTGGSSVVVGIEVVKILENRVEENLLKNLVVTLTDERYGEVNHKDSNWYQLVSRGFNLKGARLIHILICSDSETTLKAFNKVLTDELEKADYKIGLFGIGKDMHTAGILPNTVAADSDDFACGYDTSQFSRITITPKTILKLNEAVVYLKGQEKKDVVKNLEKENDVKSEPAQMLKKIPKLNIFANYE